MFKDLQCIIGWFQTWLAIWKRINTAEQKDRLTSFLTLNVLEAKIFQYVFLEGHNVWEKRLSVVAIMVTKARIFGRKDEIKPLREFSIASANLFSWWKLFFFFNLLALVILL